jgi:hypothetical protein
MGEAEAGYWLRLTRIYKLVMVSANFGKDGVGELITRMLES